MTRQTVAALQKNEGKMNGGAATGTRPFDDAVPAPKALQRKDGAVAEATQVLTGMPPFSSEQVVRYKNAMVVAGRVLILWKGKGIVQLVIRQQYMWKEAFAPPPSTGSADW